MAAVDGGAQLSDPELTKKYKEEIRNLVREWAEDGQRGGSHPISIVDALGQCTVEFWQGIVGRRATIGMLLDFAATLNNADIVEEGQFRRGRPS